MFEISISPRSRELVARTRYDAAIGYQFVSRLRAEAFCRELNLFCFQERFVVIRVAGSGDSVAAGARPTMRAAA